MTYTIFGDLKHCLEGMSGFAANLYVIDSLKFKQLLYCIKLV